MENLIELVVSGQVIEISGQAFIRNEEGELVPLELQQGVIGGTEIILIDDAYIRVAAENGEEVIYDVDNPDGLVYNSGLDDDTAQEIADIQSLIEGDEDGELELEATAAGQGGQGGGQGAPTIDNSNQETLASSRYDTNLEAGQSGQGAPENANEDPVDGSPQANSDSASVAEDNSIAVNVLENDSDPNADDITLVDAVAENGTVEINEDGTIIYNPDENYNGTDTVTYTVTDSTGETSTGTLTVVVTPVDDPTIIQQTPPPTIQATDVDAQGQVIATDVDDPDLTVVPTTIVGTYGEFTIDENGNWTYTVNEDAAATLAENELVNETFTITLSNGVTTTVQININGTDDLPVVSLGSGTLVEDEVSEVSGQLTAEDADNPDLAFEAETITGVYGDLTVDAEGNWTFVPNARIQTLADGEEQNETFTVTLTDGTTTTVTINLTGSDDQAVISSGTGSVVEDSQPTTSGQLTASDADNPNLVFVAETITGFYGELTVDETGAWTFVSGPETQGLAEGEQQTEVFTITLSDGSTTTVTIDLTGTDDAPVVTVSTDTGSGNEGSEGSGSSTGSDGGTSGSGSTTGTGGSSGGTSGGTFEVTDEETSTASGTITVSDPDNPELVVVAETITGEYGEIVVDENGNWTFNTNEGARELAEGEEASEVYIITLSDGTTIDITINITGTDDAPVITADTGSVVEDIQPATTGQLTASDADNPNLQFVAGSQTGAYGELSVNADGSWSYVLNNNAQALTEGEVVTETFTVTLNDGSTTTVTLTVTGSDEAPVISSGIADITEDVSTTASGQLTATDADNPDLEFVAETITGQYGELTVDADGNWSFVQGPGAQALAGGEQQSEVYTITLSDGSTTTVTVNMTGTDDAAVISTATANVTEDSAPTASGQLTASDVDNPDLTFVAGTITGQYGEVTVDADGNWTFTAGPGAQSLAGGEQQTETYTITLSDGSTTDITVNFTGTDDAPVISTATGSVVEDSQPTASGQLTATDADNPNLQFVASNQSGTYGDLTLDADGNWTYTLNDSAQVLVEGEIQSETFTVTLNDGSTTTITMTVTGSGSDQVPTISTGTANVTEDLSPTDSGQLTATDPDNPGLAFVPDTIVGQYGELTVDANGNWVFTAGPGAQALAGGEVQTEVYTVTLTDGKTTTVTVNLTGNDDAPIIGTSSGTVTEDSQPSVSGTVNASDVDNPDLAFNAGQQNGTYGQLTIDADGNWTYTLDETASNSLQGGQQVTETFTVTLSDGNTTTIQVSVTGTDDAPVISAGVATANEDDANISGQLTAEDPDNPALAFVASNQTGAYGELSVDTNGNWVYTPNANAQTLAAGEQQDEIFTITLNDGSTTTVTVSVVGSDDAPVISTATANVTEDTVPTASGQLTASDVDNPGLTFVAGTITGQYGEVSVDADGNWVFTAGPGAQTLGGGETATETYTITLSDGSTTSVTVNFTGNDDAPVISTSSGDLTEDAAPNVSGQISFSDVDNPDMEAVPKTFVGAYGSLTVDAQGQWTYTPNANIQALAAGEQQTETFTVTFNDGSSTTVQINLTGTDDAPVISSATANVTEDSAPTASGTLTATDADNPGLAFNPVTQVGTYGDLTIDTNGNWSFTLNGGAQALAGGEVQSETFTVTLNDGSTTTISVNVTGTDDAPIISTGTASVTEDTNPTASGQLTASDVDNPGLAFVADTIVGTYGSVTVDQTGAWTFTAGPGAQALAGGEVQTETYTVTLNDGSTTTIAVTLTGTDDAPVISTGSGSVIEDTAPTTSGQLTATDADNPGLAFNAGTIVGTYGSLTIDSTGAWSFTAGAGADQLAENEVQTETYTVTLNDGSTTTVQITLTGTDDAPVISSAVASVTEDTDPTASGTLTATDADNPGLQFFAGTVGGTYGDLTIDSAGNWTYTLNNNAQALSGGEQAQDVITVYLNDGSTTTVTVNITGTEDAPVVSVGVGVVTEDTTPSVSGNLSVTDVDSPDLLFVDTTLNGTYGDLTVDANGAWTYVLNAAAQALAGGEVQTEVFTVFLQDGTSTTVTIDVNGTDGVPVISTGIGAVVEDITTSVGGTLTATDEDNAGLLFNAGVQNGLYGDLTVDSNGVWSYQLNANAEALAGGQQETEIFTLTLTDGSTTTIQINITGTDDLPVISAGVGVAVEGVSPTATGTLTATDADNGSLAFVDASIDGTYGTLTIGTDGTWSYTLNANAEVLGAGETDNDIITVTLSDGSTTTVNITVTGTDDAPVISTGVGAVIEDVSPTITGNLTASDVDNPGLLFVNATLNGTYGDLTIGSDGAWSYALNANAQALGSGDNETELFTVTLSDGSTTTIQISVQGTDDLPTVSVGVGAAIENVTTNVSGTLTAVDVDNPLLEFTAGVQNGIYGDLTVDANGVWNYQLNANAEVLAGGEQQTEVFTVSLSDGTTTTVSITVTGTDDLPVITTGVGAVVEDVSPTITGNLTASDVDNPALLFLDTTVNGTYGDLTIGTDGSWSYTLNANAQALQGGETGNELLTVQLSDGSTTTIQITVTGTDDLPVITAGAGVVFEDSQPSISGNVSATDADNPSLAFLEATIVGSEGTLTIDANGAWTYTLNPGAQTLSLGEVVTETFNVTLNDGSTTPIVITVNGENDLPVISSATTSITEDVDLSVGGQLTYTDIDSLDVHTFVAETLVGTYGSLTIDTAGNWLYTPGPGIDALAAGELQSDVFTVTLSDGSQSTIQVDITGTDDLPVISTGVGAVVESITPSISGTLTATDPDNTDLAFLNATVNGNYGLLTISSNGVWNYELDARADALAAGETQTEVLTVQLNDGSTTNITITVTGTDSLPVISTGTGSLIEDVATTVTGVLTAVDADNPLLEFVGGVYNGLFGDVTIDASGAWSYVANAAAQTLAAGETVTDVITINLNDGSVATIEINLTGSNDIPVITPVLDSILEGGLAINGNIDVVDVDVLDVNLFVPTTLNGSYGILTVDAFGNYTYTPSAAIEGLADGETFTENFIVTLTDGTTGSVQIDVTGTNDIPVVTPVLSSLTEGSLSVSGSVNVVDADIADVNLFVPETLNGTYGNLTIDALGNWVYTPTAAIDQLADGQAATEVITVSLQSGETGIITINLLGTDDAPIISTGAGSIVEGIDLSVAGVLSATDVDNPLLAFVPATLVGSYGSLVVDALGNWVYTPSALLQTLADGQQESELFTISLNDGSTTTVTVDLTGADTLPLISTGVGSVIENAIPVVAGKLTADDPDGTNPTFNPVTLNGLYGDLVLSSNGQWTYTLNANAEALGAGQSANDIFNVFLSDGSSTNITVAVNGSDDLPTISTGSATISEDASAAVTGLLTATDPDNPSLTFVPDTQAGLFGTFNIASDGTWSYEVDTAAQFLKGGEIGTEVFQVQLSDGSITQVQVDVQGDNDSGLILSLLGLVTGLLGVVIDGLGNIVTAAGTTITDALFNVAGTLTEPDPSDPTLLYVATEITGDYGTLIVDASGAYNFIVRSGASLIGVDETQLQAFRLPLSDGSFATLQLELTGSTDIPVVSQVTSFVIEDVLPDLSGQIAVQEPGSGNSILLVETVVSGTYGDLTVAADGTWDFTLSAAAQALGAGEQVTETFDLPLVGGGTTSLVLNILGQDDAPLIDVGTGSAAEDTVESVAGKLDAIDVDNPNLEIIADVIVGAYGDLTIDSLGNWVYVLNEGAQALAEGETQYDVLTVNLSDGNSTTVTIGVTGSADAPLAIETSVSTNDTTSYVFGTGDFPYTDAEGDTLLAVKITTLPSDGELRLNGSLVVANQEISLADIAAGNLEYIPDSGISVSLLDLIEVQLTDDGINFGNTVPLNINVAPTVVTSTQNIKSTKQTAVSMDEQAVADEAITSVQTNLTETPVSTGTTTQGVQAGEWTVKDMAGRDKVKEVSTLPLNNTVQNYEVSAELNQTGDMAAMTAFKYAILFGAMGPNDYYSAEVSPVEGTDHSMNLSIIKTSGGIDQVVAELEPYEFMRSPADSLSVKVNGDTGSITATAGLAHVIAKLDNVPSLKNVSLYAENNVEDVFKTISIEEFGAYEYDLSITPQLAEQTLTEDVEILVSGLPVDAKFDSGEPQLNGAWKFSAKEANALTFETSSRIDTLEVQTGLTSQAESNSSTKIISLVNTDKPVTAVDEVEVFKLLAHSDTELNSFTLENFDSESGLDGALEHLDLSDLLPDAVVNEQDPLSNYLSVSVEGNDTKIVVDANQDGKVESEITLSGVDLISMYGGNDDVVKSLLDDSITKND